MSELKRETGILLPVFSLPNPYGIGTFGKEAYDFVNFLHNAKQRYWQVLPLGPTSYGDSPYQSFSVFAGNPYFIDFDILNEDGLLEKEEYEYLYDDSLKIDYGKIYSTRFIVLRKAYDRFDKTLLKTFKKEHAYWVNDYATFMAIKDSYDGKSFLEWDDSLKKREPKALNAFIKEHKNDIDFYIFLQYEFYKQWANLRTYANNLGIKIIGDMPIYTALDSSDVWSKKEEFLLDENLNPTLVAGCPPDYFCPKGQLWGNPLYDYKHMKENNYEWWVKRVYFATKLYDTIRIDHFRGFEAYYTIPNGALTAENGKWKKGPNVALFNAIKNELGDIDIICENLGFLTPGVDKMLNKLGYPGMKILEFGFNPNGDSDAAMHNLAYNMVVYPGTHDNAPIRGWFDDLTLEEKNYVYKYLYFSSPYEAGNMLIREALASVCKISIISYVDYLQKGNEARINVPSSNGENWVWRMAKGDMNDDLNRYIKDLTLTYRRCAMDK